MDANQLDSANHFEVVPDKPVTVPATRIAVHHILVKRPIVFDRSEALNLGGWLLAIADPDGAEADRLLAEIRGRRNA